MKTELRQISKLASARNNLDIQMLSNLLAADIVYTAQEKKNDISGKKAVIEYMRSRFEFISSLSDKVDRGIFVVAKINMPTKLGQLCLAYIISNEIQAVWLPSFNEDKFISRIDIITIYPDPKTAELLTIN